MGIGSLSWNVSYALHTITEKRILDYPENSRPTKTILDWPENSRPTKKFSTAKKILDQQKTILDRPEVLDRPKNFSTHEKKSRKINMNSQMVDLHLP